MDRAAMEELLRLAKGGTRVRIDLAPNEALMLVNLVQVASASAATDGPDRELGQRLVATIASFFGTRTALGELIRNGWTVAR